MRHLFVADDGTQFDSAAECEKHEDSADVRAFAAQWWKDKYPDASPELPPGIDELVTAVAVYVKPPTARGPDRRKRVYISPENYRYVKQNAHVPVEALMGATGLSKGSIGNIRRDVVIIDPTTGKIRRAV